LILFKKIFLLNSKKYFCVNYFISRDALHIPDHNLFVASEIKTLMPVSNPALFNTFLESNAWVGEYLPNKLGYNTAFLNCRKRQRLHTRLLQSLLQNRLGDWLDECCFRLTYATWKRKYSDLALSDFELNFRSGRHVSKHHPRG